MIKISTDSSSERTIVVRIGRVKDGVGPAIFRGVVKATTDLTTYIKEVLLSGEVLQVRSGNLRRAVHSHFEGNNVGIVSVGSEAHYGFYHEYGVDHPWTIQAKQYSNIETHHAHSLHWSSGGDEFFAASVTHPGLEERSFMRRGLADQHDEIITTIREEVHAAVAS